MLILRNQYLIVSAFESLLGGTSANRTISNIDLTNLSNDASYTDNSNAFVSRFRKQISDLPERFIDSVEYSLIEPTYKKEVTEYLAIENIKNNFFMVRSTSKFPLQLRKLTRIEKNNTPILRSLRYLSATNQFYFMFSEKKASTSCIQNTMDS